MLDLTTGSHVSTSIHASVKYSHAFGEKNVFKYTRRKLSGSNDVVAADQIPHRVLASAKSWGRRFVEALGVSHSLRPPLPPYPPPNIT